MATKTPRHIHRWSLWVAMGGAPLTLGALLAWGFQVVPDRPTLVFMIYQAMLLITVGAGIVAAITKGQLAIARAFAAGYNTGLAVAEQQTNGDHPPPIPLRLVD